LVIRFKARERREYEEYKTMLNRNKKASMRDEKTGKKLSRKQQKINKDQKKQNAVSASKAAAMNKKYKRK
jgi:hypothetical protein